jgi:hypothetical protein
MKPSHASQIRRAAISRGDLSRYEATHPGGLSILEKGRPTSSWSPVSPVVLGDIDHYVYALAGR